MKLNPPETAPKDGTMILVCFHNSYLSPAVWSSVFQKWATTFLEVSGVSKIMTRLKKSIWINTHPLKHTGLSNCAAGCPCPKSTAKGT